MHKNLLRGSIRLVGRPVMPLLVIPIPTTQGSGWHCTSPTSVYSSCRQSIFQQKRFLSLFDSPTVREEMAFLSERCPVDTLELKYDANLRQENVIEAFERLSQLYGPRGKRPNPGKLDAVERAYKIMRNVNSVWYERAQPDDKVRLNLRLELYQGSERIKLQFSSGIYFLTYLLAILMVIKLVMLPIEKMHRAVTRQ